MIFACTISLLAMLGQVGAANDAPSANAGEKSEFKPWAQFYTQQAAEYRIFAGNGTQHELELQSTPVLQYSNPVRPTDQHGTVYVWTHDGRPEAIGSMWSSQDPKDSGQRVISHEFQSLSVDPIMSQHAKRVGRQGVVPDWKTSEAGIEWRLLPDDATPGKTAVSRLLQMRRLAEKFSAQITSSDVEKASDLRLLIQPLYRYSSAATGVVDGGLFSFVLATDPELLLMVELRETKDGSRWHYAAARFTNRPLKLMHGNLEVWSCAKAEAYVGHQPYFLYWGVGRRSSAFDR